VRDSVLGLTPTDWDVCTSALPSETIECFGDRHIIETGLKHGTVTVRVNHTSFEVTTYRVDGEYTDSRRPDSVEFVRDIESDLSRRDFTVNAMAYNTSLLDPFGGLRDLSDGVIRCVGDASRRFREDALRIMRAVRFASVLGFGVESGTRRALFDNTPLLQNISAERIAAELNKLLLGDNVFDVLMNYRDVFAQVLPETRAAFDFNQHNPHHIYDVWEHTARAVTCAPRELVPRLALLFHDLGKPACYSEKDGVGHFYGHAEVSVELARAAMNRLKYPNAVMDDVRTLVLLHDTAFVPQMKNIRRWLSKMPYELFCKLADVKRADTTAQAPQYRAARYEVIDEALRLAEQIIAEGQCLTRKDLAVSGGDVAALGVQGSDIGWLLEAMLERVIDGELPNEREVLLEFARGKIENM
jgi:tRNA nucleotidyltransferase (CCA-adding enzyme)